MAGIGNLFNSLNHLLNTFLTCFSYQTPNSFGVIWAKVWPKRRPTPTDLIKKSVKISVISVICGLFGFGAEWLPKLLPGAQPTIQGGVDMPTKNPIFLTPTPEFEQTLKNTANLLGISLSAVVCKGLEAQFGYRLKAGQRFCRTSC